MKKLIFITKIIIIIFIVSFLIIEGLIIIDGNRVSSEKVDYIIVLGARVYEETPSPALMERLKTAEEYLKENNVTKVVVSGGQGEGENIAEAFAMGQYFEERGIEQSEIIFEDKSRNTFENLKMSINKIKEHDVRDDIKVLIVSNKHHIFRAKFLAKRLGVKAYGLGAKIPPSIILHSYLREYFAVIKSFMFDR